MIGDESKEMNTNERLDRLEWETFEMKTGDRIGWFLIEIKLWNLFEKSCERKG
jgi:hypothetical protein